MKKLYLKFLTHNPCNRKKKHAFLEDLASLLADGITLNEATLMLIATSSGYTQKMAYDINTNLAQGKSLADGLFTWLPPTIIEIIRSGENAGTLAQALQSAADALNQQTSLISSLLTSITYPAVVLLLALTLLVVIKQTVLENFAAIKPVVEWPQTGIALYHFATYIEYGWWAILFIALLGGFAGRHLFTHYTGKWRHKIDAYPLLGFYRDTVAARFMKTLGLLINNGIILKKALHMLSYEASPYLAWHIMLMEYQLSSGIDNIAEALDTQLLKPDELLRLKITAKGRGFAAALIKLGEQSTKRNYRIAHYAGRIFGGALLVSSAIIAMHIILGIYAIGSALTL